MGHAAQLSALIRTPYERSIPASPNPRKAALTGGVPFLGLVPRQNSSGGKDRLGRISKMGAGYLRKLLVVGATSVIRRARTGALAAAPWIRSLLERRPARVVTVAMANKTARIVWAVLARGDVYRPPATAARS